MQFSKMNGLGNDFVVIHHHALPSNIHEMAVIICDRHFGIGADGLVYILPSSRADFQMRIFNADGSEAEQCGNAIRCVGKYVYDHRLTEKTRISVETLAGVQQIELRAVDRRVEEIRVNMGQPVLEASKIPVAIDSDRILNHPIQINDQTYYFTAVSMGNPHAVIEVEDAARFPVDRIGPQIENHPFFPRKTNVEFITIHNEQEITMRVWERGAGETYACGTGACASVVSAVLQGKTSRQVLVHLKGGDLHIEWDRQSGEIYMTGPAQEVFSGEWKSVEYMKR